jgi:hypothetical protein
VTTVVSGVQALEATGPQGAHSTGWEKTHPGEASAGEHLLLNHGTYVRSGHPQKGAADRVSAAATAELKALHRKGSADGWPPVAFLEIAAWLDRHRPDDPALAHRWRRWGGFQFVPNQQRPAAGMNRTGGAL